MSNITKISQRDKRWKNSRIGFSATTIGKEGCTICALCMALEKLRGYFCNPKNAAWYWKFNRRGQILWNKTQFKGMEFKWRGYGHNSAKIRDYANGKDRAVIIEVNHNHWLYVVESTGKNTFRVIDPWNGLEYATVPSNYKITGYALFEKKEHVPEYMRKVIGKAEEKGLKVDAPLDKLNIKTLEAVLKELDIIEKVEGQISLGRLLVIMEKISERW